VYTVLPVGCGTGILPVPVDYCGMGITTLTPIPTLKVTLTDGIPEHLSTCAATSKLYVGQELEERLTELFSYVVLCGICSFTARAMLALQALH